MKHVLFMLFVFVHTASAQPFGIQMGSDPESLGCDPGDNPGVWICETVPKPHSAFDGYAVVSSPETGIGEIRAITAIVENDAYGYQIRSKMKSIVDQIAAKYGTNQVLTDQLMYDSIWDEPNDWSRGLSQNERVYRYDWKDMNVIIDNVQEITISARASRSDAVYAILFFRFSNYGEMRKSIEDKEASAF